MTKGYLKTRFRKVDDEKKKLSGRSHYIINKNMGVITVAIKEFGSGILHAGIQKCQPLYSGYLVNERQAIKHFRVLPY